MQETLKRLHAVDADARLAALGAVMQDYESGVLPRPERTSNVNNHIHTIYSFSPYSPTSAAYAAWNSGLDTAGIMDHDSVAGCREFIRAGELLDISTTIGFECRCSIKGSPFEGRYINNPDQPTVLYAACHGIPHHNIELMQQWLTPYRERRVERLRRMADNIGTLLAGSPVTMDFDEDVLPLSQYHDGGSVTERHLLCALATKIIQTYPDGAAVAAFLRDGLGMSLGAKNLQTILQGYEREYYEYYLLGILKSELTSRFFIDATDECPDIWEFLSFVKQAGAIPAYPYLGDVGESVTGDKKAQVFEDSFLDELVAWLKDIGFDALTYMPTRNTIPQLERVMELCRKFELFQISGEDINTPFQSFICEPLRRAEFQHLIESTWALIGHEKAATADLSNAMFSQKMRSQIQDLPLRVRHYASMGREASE